MIRSFGDLAPIKAALAEIEQLETAQYNDDVARALCDVRKKLAAALKEAEHPELAEGLTTDEYAKLHGITRQAVYKRIRTGKVRALRKPGVGFVIQAA